jgi:hypothetical protein
MGSGSVPKTNVQTTQRADYDPKKRIITWEVNDFKGGSSKQLEVNFSYNQDTLIDEF